MSTSSSKIGGVVLLWSLLVVAAAACPASGQRLGCDTQTRRVSFELTEQPYGSLPYCGVLNYAAVFAIKSADLPPHSYLVVHCPSGFHRLLGRRITADVAPAPIDARWLRRPTGFLWDHYRAVPGRTMFAYCRYPEGA